MPRIVIELTDGQYGELRRATARAGEPGFTPKDWAREAVESALASHRLPRVTLGRGGARVRIRAAEPEPEPEAELVTHRVMEPERVCQS
jgi:hypothetical protein